MWGIIGIGIAIAVFWVMFQRLRTTASKETQGPFSLQTKPEVASADVTKLLLNSTNTGTIQAFVYPLQAQKTGTVTLCNPSGSANPGEPDCSTGLYNVCACTGNDCSKCAHSGYVNVLNISNVVRLELLASPDAGRPNAASTQLVVRTVGLDYPMKDGKPDNTQPKVQVVFEETIPLPTIPYQKWTFVSLAREGRRFDVYYNGEIVVSKRVQNTLDVKAAYGPIVAGDPNLLGTLALVEAFPEKLSQPEIQKRYKKLSDTTGSPSLSKPIDFFAYMPSCEGGDCISGPKVRPTSPLLDWETPYA